MSALDVLTKTRELLSDPERWTKGSMAKNASGCTVRPDREDAVCFCLDGALTRAAGGSGNGYPEATRILEETVSERPWAFCYVDWNDDAARTHAEVLAALDKAIDLARGRQ